MPFVTGVANAGEKGKIAPAIDFGAISRGFRIAREEAV